MSRKIYKSAMGKTVDLGALLLQNEQVRAVGNMGVNAAGDRIDSTNRVIDSRNRQMHRQYQRQSNVQNAPVATSNLTARKMKHENEQAEPESLIQEPAEPVVTQPNQEADLPKSGGLAAAIARSREIKQELEKTLRQQQQEQGLRKI